MKFPVSWGSDFIYFSRVDYVAPLGGTRGKRTVRALTVQESRKSTID